MNPANSDLKYSKSGLALTESFEGLRLTAYQDQGGVWTIGYGHVGKEAFPGNTITQQHAEALLEQDVIWAETAVKNYVKVPILQSEFDALVDFVFNCGAGNFEKSTLLKYLNAERWEEAKEEFTKWDHVAGKENKGLARRRLAEAELFAHGIVTHG